MLCYCSWRVNRRSILSDAQWNTAKRTFLQYVPRFFPDNAKSPCFVPLDDDVTIRLDDLIQDLPAAEPGVDAGVPHEEPDAKKRRIEELPPAAALAPASAAAASSRMALDMDGDQKADDRKEDAEKDKDLDWELANWFSPDHGAVFMNWNDPESQPKVQWLKLQSNFQRLAILAHRFLCIPPSSAPSERVWSGFGHVVNKYSSTIDSSLAAKIMFLRYNKELLNAIPFS